MATPELVDFQLKVATEHDQDDYSLSYDVTALPLQQGDIVVAGLWATITGGGSTWWCDFGSGRTLKTSGPWSDIPTTGTAWDTGAGTGVGVNIGGFLLQTVDTQVDDGMLEFGWHGGTFTNNLALGMAVWVFRNATFDMFVDDDGDFHGDMATNVTKTWTPTTTLVGPLESNQVYLSLSGAFNNSGTHQVSAISNDLPSEPAGSDDAAEAWTAFQPYDNTMFAQTELGTPGADDVSTVNWTLVLGNGTGSDAWYADVNSVIIQFEESFVPPPAGHEDFELPFRMRNQELPYQLTRAMIR